jgi:hypothetical protein
MIWIYICFCVSRYIHVQSYLEDLLHTAISLGQPLLLTVCQLTRNLTNERKIFLICNHNWSNLKKGIHSKELNETSKFLAVHINPAVLMWTKISIKMHCPNFLTRRQIVYKKLLWTLHIILWYLLVILKLTCMMYPVKCHVTIQSKNYHRKMYLSDAWSRQDGCHTVFTFSVSH